MEWVVFVLVGVLMLGWWLGRARSDSAGYGTPSTSSAPSGRQRAPRPAPGAAAVGAGFMAGGAMTGALEQDDPDGAFIEGYVVGRLTERAASPPVAGADESHDRAAWLEDDAWCGSDDFVFDEDSLDDLGTADLDDAFHDDTTDDW